MIVANEMYLDKPLDRFQFSLRSLFVWTTLAAISCALAVWQGAFGVVLSSIAAALFLMVRGIRRRQPAAGVTGAVLVAILIPIALLIPRAHEPPPPPAVIPPPHLIPPVEKPWRVTHYISKDTDYFLNDPRQGRPPDGSFQAGTEVWLSSREAGSYLRVASEDGVWAYVAAESVKPIDSSKPSGASTRKLRPAFPFVVGRYQMYQGWSVDLPERFNERTEGGNLVFWRPGLTIWTTVWPNFYKESKEQLLTGIRKDIASDAFDIKEFKEKDVLRLAYRLKENADDKRVAGFYGFAVGENGFVDMTIYFDDESDLAAAESVWRSLKH